MELKKANGTSKDLAATTKLYMIEAKEVNYNKSDKICW